MLLNLFIPLKKMDTNLSLITSRLTTVCRCSLSPFISRAALLLYSLCVSQLCHRSLIFAHLAVCFIRLKETPCCRHFSLRLEKCFVAPKLVSVGQLHVLIRVFGLRSEYHRYRCLSFVYRFVLMQLLWLVMDCV